jgi:hypothetical protein
MLSLLSAIPTASRAYQSYAQGGLRIQMRVALANRAALVPPMPYRPAAFRSLPSVALFPATVHRI